MRTPGAWGWPAVPMLVLLLLPGCVTQDGKTSTTHACPAWIPGLDHFVAHSSFDTNYTDQPDPDEFPLAKFFSTTVPTDDGNKTYPLDIVTLDFRGSSSDQPSGKLGITVTNARLDLRFFRADTHAPLKAFKLTDGRDSAKDTWSFGPGTYRDFALQVNLVRPDSTPSPTAIRVEYTFAPHLDGNPSSHSRATLDFAAQYQYRTC